VWAQTALAVDATGCVYREGDDRVWAAAELDEAGWTPLAEWPGLATRTPDYWLRCRFEPGKLNPSIEPALQVTGDLSYEVYVDGSLAGRFGNLETGDHTTGDFGVFHHPAFSRRSGPVTVALRMAFTPQVLVQEPMPQLELGDQDVMRGHLSEQVTAKVKGRWITFVCSGIILAAGLFFVALYWLDRTQSYLLWAGLCWTCIGELRVNEFLRYAAIPYPSRLEMFLYGSGQYVELCALLLFFRLAEKPLNRFYRVVAGLILTAGLLYIPIPLLPLRAGMVLRWLLDASPTTGALCQSAWIVAAAAPIVVFWPLTRVRRGQVAMVCACFFWMVTEVPYLIAMFPGVPRVGDWLSVLQKYRSVAILAAVATLTLLLIKRLRETNRQRATLAGEMQAARHIQQMLAPAELKRAPGCNVEVVFLPAREVGGDFYLCRVLPDGGQRVLLGDVSGKGAAAAMTAALLIGAAERRDGDSPAMLLGHMNKVLFDCNVGGFATCLCADLASDGRLTLANAGQLAPYRNGDELSSEAALPLGLMLESVYSESVWKLEPGDRITLLSDGVVEARNAAGDLFGFERTAEISGQSAETIAQEAQRFGQEDDITVLTLSFAGTGAI
jgi:hypothetical protein